MAMTVESEGAGVCASVGDGLHNKRRLLPSSRNAFTNAHPYGGGEPRRELLARQIDDGTTRRLDSLLGQRVGTDRVAV